MLCSRRLALSVIVGFLVDGTIACASPVGCKDAPFEQRTLITALKLWCARPSLAMLGATFEESLKTKKPRFMRPTYPFLVWRSTLAGSINAATLSRQRLVSTSTISTHLLSSELRKGDFCCCMVCALSRMDDTCCVDSRRSRVCCPTALNS